MICLQSLGNLTNTTKREYLERLYGTINDRNKYRTAKNYSIIYDTESKVQ